MVAREIGVNGNGLTDRMTGRTTRIHNVTRAYCRRRMHKNYIKVQPAAVICILQ